MSDDEDLAEMRRLRQTSGYQKQDGGAAAGRAEMQRLRDEADAAERRSAALSVSSSSSSSSDGGPPLAPLRKRDGDDDDDDGAVAWRQPTKAAVGASKLAFGSKPLGLGAKPSSAAPPTAPPPPTAAELAEQEAMKQFGFNFKSFGAKSAVKQTAVEKNVAFKRTAAELSGSTAPLGAAVAATSSSLPATSLAARPAASSSSAPPSRAAGDDSDDDDDSMGPSIPSQFAAHVPSGLEDAFSNPFNLPISHEAVMSGHTRSVAAMALDPGGSRLLTGSIDYDVKFWDFAGMDSSFRSFRQVTPHDGHPVEQLRYSITGDSFLVATGEHCAKLYDRDGHALGEYSKGDMYIMDMKHTKGHCAALSDLHFHPRDRQTFISASLDGSVRVWDVENFKTQTTVIKVKSAKKRCQVTCCAYAPDASFILAGTNEGSLQLFDTKGKYMWADKSAQAHGADTTITALLMASNGHTVASRALDDSLKVWDLRKFREPVQTFADLPCHCAQTDMAFSPDEQLIITGTSMTDRIALPSSAAASSSSSSVPEAERRKVKTHELRTRGQIVFIDRTNLEIVQHVAVANGAINRVLWHPKLNQIFACSSDSKIHALYDPQLSVKGVLLSAGKAQRKKSAFDFLEQTASIAPTVAPSFKDKTKGATWREERNKSKPEVPGKSGPGKRAASAHASFHDFLTSHLVNKTVHSEDPRAAVLKYADEAKTPMFFRSYAATQPEAEKRFDEEFLEEEAALEAAKPKVVVDEDEAPVHKKFKSSYPDRQQPDDE